MAYKYELSIIYILDQLAGGEIEKEYTKISLELEEVSSGQQDIFISPRIYARQ